MKNTFWGKDAKQQFQLMLTLLIFRQKAETLSSKGTEIIKNNLYLCLPNA